MSPFNAKSSNIKSSLTKGISSEKLLGITTDSNFTFEKHLNELSRKSSLKLHVLTRCAKLMSTEKRLSDYFKNSAIQLFPISMEDPYQKPNNRINSLHEKALIVTYQDRN